MKSLGKSLVKLLIFIFILAIWSNISLIGEDELKTPVFKVKTVKDIPYYTGPDADKKKHVLDIYIPEGCEGFPVLIFIHGGGWKRGDKNPIGPCYENIGHAFAKNGIGAVLINYRLSPSVTHPEHIKDCARAFKWTLENIGKYGGNNKNIIVSGHSAGAHLSALLATNEKYLGEQGLSVKDIAGIIALSGVYTVHQDLFGAFGKDPDSQKDASPIDHIKQGLPPFFIIYAQKDPVPIRYMSKEFANRLKKVDSDTMLSEIPDRTHSSIVFKIGSEGDMTTSQMLTFIQHLTKQKK